MMWTVTFKRGDSPTNWTYWVNGDDVQDAYLNGLNEARRYTQDALMLINIRNERGEMWYQKDLNKLNR